MTCLKLELFLTILKAFLLELEYKQQISATKLWEITTTLHFEVRHTYLFIYFYVLQFTGSSKSFNKIIYLFTD